tara:strand:+ start:885 stop:1088 length:204 start_codon:yes stop_codon:yes gene_type:complete
MEFLIDETYSEVLSPREKKSEYENLSDTSTEQRDPCETIAIICVIVLIAIAGYIIVKSVLDIKNKRT